ncbi:aspartic proteinase-like protein 1 isoform X2 [Syzygium oleosum]|uniref:aspartic proteinase-like protein 1 isoform X2 n=1 Tax=Syzygium oleosum TaxID=219896 RepID=UPI0024BA1406|nr:aspartic proteinase-like protein 1 isoform X2 [Syzygium oleosum]
MAALLLLLPVSLLLSCLAAEGAAAVTFSSRLIHRFSDEVRALRDPGGGGGAVPSNASAAGQWPEKRSVEYYQVLVASDFRRQNMKLGTHYQLLFPSEGSQTMWLGNEFGWLHYSWIDVGSPSVSFLVALDAGSDLLWLPCECVQCAPLSASHYSSLDRDLNEYNPSGSNSSKHITCSHQLCKLGPSCKSPGESCPYIVNYYSENTSTSGLLVEDILHLASGSGRASNSSVSAPVIMGCGMKQSGGYLDGVAPDGLMGLGLGEISVPSFLAKGGLVPNSFSLCFVEDDSGTIFFGDQGPANQKYTAFLPSNGKYETYIVGVEACCIGNSCLKQTSFSALVDSGTSFTFLPNGVFETITQEFDRRVNATHSSIEGYPWKYCYKPSTKEKAKVPSLTLVFPLNNSFVVYDPVFKVYGMEGLAGFCLAIQPTDGDIGTIGQNFMMGYRMVFDRENLKLGWSRSNCQDLDDDRSMPLTPNGRSPNPLPTTEQQSAPGGHAVAPAVAGRALSKPSAASQKLISSHLSLISLMPLLLLVHFLATFRHINEPFSLICQSSLR